MTKGKSLGIMIVSAIFLAILLFVPFSIDGSLGFVFSYNYMPIIGNNTLPEYFASIVAYLPHLISGLPEIVATILSYFVSYGLYVVLGVLAFNIVFGLLYLIIGEEVIRIIARIISAISGIVLIFLTIFYLGVIAISIFIIVASGAEDIGAVILDYVKNGGFITTISLNLVCFISIFKQFKYFRKI